MKLVRDSSGKRRLCLVSSDLTKTSQTEPSPVLESPAPQPAPAPAAPASPVAPAKPPPAKWSPYAAREEEKGKNAEDWISQIKTSYELKDTQYGQLEFFVLRETHPSLAEKLGRKGLGFTFFKNRKTGEATWSMKAKDAKAKMSQLQEFGLDCSPLNSPPVHVPANVSDIAPELLPSAEQPKGEEMPPEMRQWQAELAEAKKLPPKDRKAGYIDIVNRAMEKLGSDVQDPTIQATNQMILKRLLDASSKFHNYSFRNTFLIAMTKPWAEYVAGRNAWAKMGRFIRPDVQAAEVLFPVSYQRNPTQREQATLPPEQLDKLKGMSFWLGDVYAYQDTLPIPGWKNKKGEGPFEPPEWRIDSNDATEWLMQLYDAAYRWATEVKNYKITTGNYGRTGGWASGTKEIGINDKYDGINKIAILFHEIAHQLLHWDEKFRKQDSTKQEREADAEATAYAVCSHYHIDSKMSAVYLVNYKIDKALLMSRLTNIQKAATEMFEGIDAMMENQAPAPSTETPTATPSPAEASPSPVATATQIASGNFYSRLGIRQAAKPASGKPCKFIAMPEEKAADWKNDEGEILPL